MMRGAQDGNIMEVDNDARRQTETVMGTRLKWSETTVEWGWDTTILIWSTFLLGAHQPPGGVFPGGYRNQSLRPYTTPAQASLCLWKPSPLPEAPRKNMFISLSCKQIAFQVPQTDNCILKWKQDTNAPHWLLESIAFHKAVLVDLHYFTYCSNYGIPCIALYSK